MKLQQGSDPNFYLINGKVLRDVYELLDSLDQIDDSVFNHHVNSEKNDFCNWIRDIFGDKKLASKLMRCRDRKEMASVIQDSTNGNLKKEVGEEFYFYLTDNKVIKSAGELLSALKEMDDSVFAHHVNSERNDFANWIGEVYNKKTLANQMRRCKSRNSLIKCLARALK